MVWTRHGVKWRSTGLGFEVFRIKVIWTIHSYFKACHKRRENKIQGCWSRIFEQPYITRDAKTIDFLESGIRNIVIALW